MENRDVHSALKRCVAQGHQVGPYGTPDERYYRIDEKYAAPFLANDLGLTEDVARKRLQAAAEEADAVELETAYRFWVFPAAVIDEAEA